METMLQSTDERAPTERFEIITQLGKSADMTTFKAFDRQHNRLVVIKVLAHAHYQAPEIRQHVRQQIKQLAEQRHPYLLPILRAQDSGQAYYWVQPFAGGGSLQDRINVQELTQAELLFVTSRVRSALQFLHSKGIQHLELTPNNILFSDSGTLQLADANVLPFALRFRRRELPNEAERCRLDFALLERLEKSALHHVLPDPQLVTPAAAPATAVLDRQRRALVLGILSIVCMLLFLLGQFAPLIGARAATPLRGVLGNERVAQLETFLFRMQDRSARVRYELGMAEPEIPWEPQPTVTPLPTQPVATVAALPPAVAIVETAVVSAETPVSQPQVAAVNFQTLRDIAPLGTLAGEGIWEAYLSDSNGNTVAKRTFLQPDSARPLTVVGIIAFDLEQVDLNYVLGTQEPRSSNGLRGNGTIPSGDRVPGKLIATFNGGFLSTHGGFGAMADGVTVVEPRPQLATVAIDGAGNVVIGAWGDSVLPAESWRAIRQNALLVIENGEINPDVYNNSIKDWGGTINSDIVTWRSGLGINAERNILYYVAGPSLTMPALADTLLAAGADNGMLLDINAYWVHFAAVWADGDRLRAQAMFAEEMALHVDRYLRPSERDFFYVVVQD